MISNRFTHKHSIHNSVKTILIVALGVVLNSCTDNDADIADVATPVTYSFTRANETTIDFSGQTTRIKMSEEILTSLLDNTKSQNAIQAMFAHTPGAANFSETSLNASDKNVRGKVAVSADYFESNTTESQAIKADFDGFISRQVNEVFTKWSQPASAGVAGQLQQAGGGTIRYVNAKGLEYNQAFAKGLLGGLMTDQMLNNYLSPAVLDGNNSRTENDNNILVSGKNYTAMEHYWDEAYGYLYGLEPNPAIPVLDQDSFLSEYVDRANLDNDFNTIGRDIFEAFKKGRAAIVAKNYTVRDQQAQIIKENISKVIAIRGVFYLQAAKTNLAADKARAFHSLSEAYGFIYSLQFTRRPNSSSPYFTRVEVNAILGTLTANNGFWDLSNTTLDALSDQISSRFGFTTSQAATLN